MKKYPLVLLVLLLLGGCASTRDNVEFSFRSDAEGSFLDKDQKDNYNFYVYNGWGQQPAAYLALDKKYTLETRFWYKTSMSEALWSKAYHSSTFFSEDDYRAKALISSTGETVGYIISRYYQLFAWFTTPDSNTIVVAPPALSPNQPAYSRLHSDRD